MEQRYTVILVPDGQSAVRRYTLRRSWIKRISIVAGAVLLLLLALAIDWVRLRLDAVDVAKLRAETMAQSAEILALSGDVAKAEGELERLGEFERKVRIIANLPSTLAQTNSESGDRAARGGPEGEAETMRSDHGEPPPADAEAKAESGVAPPEPEPSTARLVRAAGFRESPHRHLPTIRERAADLVRLAASRSASLAELLEGLEDKSAQLAATPSIWPTNGWVTSGYGRRVSPFTGRPHFHAGLDIAADFGTPVIAPASGKVVFAGRKGALGKAVIIDHGGRMRTWYGHLSEYVVERGQRIERGERIGSVGSTGRSTGPHLHYVVEVKGKTVNPINYVID